MAEINLPVSDGRIEGYRTGQPLAFAAAKASDFNRIAYAAAHVVADPFADVDPWVDVAIDWDGTIAYRQHLWSLGLGVAEAMDTAQRGSGVDWPTSRELIRRSLAAARATPGAVVACGVGTDQLLPRDAQSIDQVIAAYEEQIAAIEAMGGRIVLMASRALAAIARSPDDYVRVYGRILGQIQQPAILHWLGDMFDPALAGYWGSSEIDQAMATCLDVIRAHVDKVDGIKISLLAAEREVEMRRRLPKGVRMYSGDDFSYPELIEGDEQGHSDALLGIFDAIAPAASAGLAALAKGDTNAYRRILAPTVPLSRHVFRAPTRFYKTGIVFLAYLNGHQNHFVMAGGQESARSILHLAELFRLADKAGLLTDPDRAVARMKPVLATHGAA